MRGLHSSPLKTLTLLERWEVYVRSRRGRAGREMPDIERRMRMILHFVACMILAFDRKVVPHPSFQCMPSTGLYRGTRNIALVDMCQLQLKCTAAGLE